MAQEVSTPALALLLSARRLEGWQRVVPVARAAFGALFIGPEHGLTIAFVLLILLLIFKPTGIMGRRGYE